MAVNSAGVPLFAGIEDLDDMFMATMEEMDREVMDEVAISHPIYEYLQRHKLIEFRNSIATHVPVHLRTKKNPTVQWLTGYEDANSTPASLLDEAKFAYGQLTGRQMYNREELTKNSGEEQLIDLVESKGDQLLSDMNEEFGVTIIGTQDADGRKPMGLGRVMTFNAVCGGIDPTAAGMSFWNPQRGLKVGGAQYALATEMREGLRRARRLTTTSGGGKVLGKDPGTTQGIAPDVLICGEDLYDAMQSWAEGKLRMTMTDIKDSSGWGDFEMFTVNGETIIYEPALAAKTGWLMNFKKAVRVRIHSGTNFKFTEWGKLPGKVEAKYRDCLTYCAVYVKSRKANCLIEFT